MLKADTIHTTPRRSLLGAAAGLFTAAAAAADAVGAAPAHSAARAGLAARAAGGAPPVARALGPSGTGLAPVSAGAGLDPAVTLCDQLRAMEAEHDVVSREHAVMRAGFVRRHGDLIHGDPGVRLLWESDPLIKRLDCLLAECDRFTDSTTDLAQIIMDTPAMSLAGVLAKVRLAITRFPRRTSSTGFHEDYALDVLRDAERFLGAAAAPLS